MGTKIKLYIDFKAFFSYFFIITLSFSDMIISIVGTYFNFHGYISFSGLNFSHNILKNV